MDNIDIFIEACVTGRQLRLHDSSGQRRTPALSLGGFGVLKVDGLWPEVLRRLRGVSVHPDVQWLFMNNWTRVWQASFREAAGDDDLYFSGLRKMLPPLNPGHEPPTLYRGQAKGEVVGASWTRSLRIARKFAAYGIANIGNDTSIDLPLARFPARPGAVVLVARAVAPEVVICAPCLHGLAEGEYIIDPRAVVYDESEI